VNVVLVNAASGHIHFVVQDLALRIIDDTRQRCCVSSVEIDQAVPESKVEIAHLVIATSQGQLKALL
jgi:hypothetical protein